MMINNNPYNLPQRPPNKPNRIYTQTGNAQYRPQLVQNSTPYAQYKARHQQQPTMTGSSANKKNSLTIQQSILAYRQPFPPVRNQMVHFLPSPKGSQNSSGINNSNTNTSNSAGNIANNYNFNSSSNNRANVNVSSSIDKKQIGSLRESFGVSMFDVKQMNDKIQQIEKSLRLSQKRISQLQKSTSTNFLPNNSKFNNQSQNTSLLQNGDTTAAMAKYQVEWMDSFNKVMDEIHSIREQIRHSKNNNKYGNLEIERIVTQKMKQINQYKVPDSSLYRSGANQQIRKQVQNLRINMQQKTKKNFDFLTSVIGRLQRQLHSNLTILQPSSSFKPSAIKCSTTAILLRFVECFKVRKHSAKNGQVKITLTDNTYYIDSEGYLLDKEQYYIVDGRDCRVKLEDKHIRLLKQQGILL